MTIKHPGRRWSACMHVRCAFSHRATCQLVTMQWRHDGDFHIGEWMGRDNRKELFGLLRELSLLVQREQRRRINTMASGTGRVLLFHRTLRTMATQLLQVRFLQLAKRGGID